MTGVINDSDQVSTKASREPASRRCGVLVVGAGPTGLLLASELQRRGVHCPTQTMLEGSTGVDCSCERSLYQPSIENQARLDKDPRCQSSVSL